MNKYKCSKIDSGYLWKITACKTVIKRLAPLMSHTKCIKKNNTFPISFVTKKRKRKSLSCENHCHVKSKVISSHPACKVSLLPIPAVELSSDDDVPGTKE